jgi:hypothetical protein
MSERTGLSKRGGSFAPGGFGLRWFMIPPEDEKKLPES